MFSLISTFLMTIPLLDLLTIFAALEFVDQLSRSGYSDNGSCPNTLTKIYFAIILSEIDLFTSGMFVIFE